jgi:hypothetical protein
MMRCRVLSRLNTSAVTRARPVGVRRLSAVWMARRRLRPVSLRWLCTRSPGPVLLHRAGGMSELRRAANGGARRAPGGSRVSPGGGPPVGAEPAVPDSVRGGVGSRPVPRGGRGGYAGRARVAPLASFLRARRAARVDAVLMLREWWMKSRDAQDLPESCLQSQMVLQRPEPGKRRHASTRTAPDFVKNSVGSGRAVRLDLSWPFCYRPATFSEGGPKHRQVVERRDVDADTRHRVPPCRFGSDRIP